MTAEDAPREVRSWPPGRELADAEAIAVPCARCGQPWRVHRSLAGYRLRCACGAFVDVPGPSAATSIAQPTTASLPAGPDELPAHHAASTDERGHVHLPGTLGETVWALVPTHLPMAPGSLRHASAINQSRWTNRTMLEFVAMLAALAGPQLAALLLSQGQEFELLLPFASLVSGVLVALVVAWAGPYGRIGFARASLRHHGEALLAAAVSLLLAIAWIAVISEAFDHEPDRVQHLTERLGTPMALFVVALTPAVLEEVMFRGVLQGRLLALFGVRTGLLLTAMAFALCHAQPVVLPIHLGIGLYLGWLRERSGSLLPGMLMHFVYNGSIVVLGIS